MFLHKADCDIHLISIFPAGHISIKFQMWRMEHWIFLNKFKISRFLWPLTVLHNKWTSSKESILRIYKIFTSSDEDHHFWFYIPLSRKASMTGFWSSSSVQYKTIQYYNVRHLQVFYCDRLFYNLLMSSNYWDLTIRK